MVKSALWKKEINPVGCSADGFKQSKTGGRKRALAGIKTRNEGVLRSSKKLNDF